jgi:hypothetical protein
MVPRRTFAGLLAALVVLLTGCGGGSSAADPPVQSSPTSTPTSDPPTHETAEHFIRRWAEAEKQMENTGKTAAYLSMSRECRSCRRLAADIRRFYGAGGFARWSGWQILSITSSGSHGDNRIYDVRVDSGPTTYRESSTSPVKHLNGGLATHQLVLNPSANSWLVAQKAQLSE